jgi:hypothetical protein
MRLSGSVPTDFEEIQKGIANIKNAVECVLKKIGEFKILDEKLVPYGLKPIARSISWLIEQMIVQNLKKYKDECGVMEVEDPPHGLTQYDCILTLKEHARKYYVNIKTSLTITDETGNFDISKAHKLVKLYGEMPDIVLLVAIAKVTIEGVHIKFGEPIVFNVAWVPNIYYNRANHNLQSKANGTQTPRSNDEFIKELKHQMEEAGHLKHY